MSFKRYFRSLNRKQQEEFCARSGLSRSYILYHVLSDSPDFSRFPSESMFRRIYEAGQGQITMLDILSDFFPELSQEVLDIVRRGCGDEGRPRPIEQTPATACDASDQRGKHGERRSRKPQRVTTDQSRHGG